MMQLSARLRSATTTIAAIGVVGLAIVLAAWINTKAVEAARQVSLSIEIRERAERFLGHIRDAETGQRGFLLTGVDAYLAPYTSGRAAAMPELESLERLVQDAPMQRERAELMRSQAIRKLNELDATIALARDGKRPEALALCATAMASSRWTSCATPSSRSSSPRT
ncbi:CHASE3 domain-containing protein [Bosea sp. BK604]|uniref:CHASE3 domain-containing protein n=1 Tax=Bosea sp. BK604 TaxID=2512180 RepID=UPI0010CE0906|nr:CHASE3 domain-containing protein [Bosea sp. BK604]TCR68707.1 CHASE3 domain sensor protein [Bosea sp. BK604]